MERANTACNAISEYAWESKSFNKFDLQKAVYNDIRVQFNLSAQMTVRCLGKVADGYKLDTQRKRVFKEHGAIAYDERILRYRTEKRVVSIWTLNGRIPVSFACGDRQLALLAYQKGESDLLYQRGKWYLFATCDIPDPTEDEVDKFLGIDRGHCKPRDRQRQYALSGCGS